MSQISCRVGGVVVRSFFFNQRKKKRTTPQAQEEEELYSKNPPTTGASSVRSALRFYSSLWAVGVNPPTEISAFSSAAISMEAGRRTARVVRARTWFRARRARHARRAAAAVCGQWQRGACPDVRCCGAIAFLFPSVLVSPRGRNLLTWGSSLHAPPRLACVPVVRSAAAQPMMRVLTSFFSRLHPRAVCMIEADGSQRSGRTPPERSRLGRQNSYQTHADLAGMLLW